MPAPTLFLTLSRKSYLNARLTENRLRGTVAPGMKVEVHNLRKIEYGVLDMRMGWHRPRWWQRFLMHFGICPHKPIFFLDCDITEGRPFPVASFTVHYCPACDKFTLRRTHQVPEL